MKNSKTSVVIPNKNIEKDKLISTSELAKQLNCKNDTINLNAKKLFPNKKFENGKTTYYTEEEATIIIEKMKNNNSNQTNLPRSVEGITTNLTQDLKMFNIKNETKELDLQKQIQLSFSIQADIIKQLNAGVLLRDEKINNLETKLGINENYYSVKRVSMINKKSQKDYNWRALKNKSFELGLEIKDEQDSNYGTVKSYHIRVWKEVYPNEKY